MGSSFVSRWEDDALARLAQNKALYAAVGAATAAGVAYLSAPDFSANEGLPPPNYPWAHKNFFTAFDHMAIRRGYTVYREVCSACHSLRHVYRDTWWVLLELRTRSSLGL